MKKPSENDIRDQLRSKIIGLGERSIRKSYYPELQQRIIELEKINTELRQEIAVRKEAEKMRGQLEQQLQQSMKMEAIGTLAGGIAHDFNNLLTAIIGYADLARVNIDRDCGKDGCPVFSHLEQLTRAGHRARELVQQILTFSRQHKHTNVPLRLGEVVREALNLLRSSLPSSIEIREDIVSGADYVCGDATKIHQIVMNIGTNGYHAMRQTGGILGVELTRVEIGNDDGRIAGPPVTPGPYLLLRMSDTGAGMDRATMERIFDPYFTTKGKSGGTGMGLATVHGIVRDHKGFITVESEPGKGAVFRVYLPQIDDSDIGQFKAQEKDVTGGEESILLVEDEELVLALETTILEDLGYSVTPCRHPFEALAVLDRRADDFDLVITDMTMPKLNGAELTRQILQRRPDMPIILCTGFSELINEKKALALGARKYVMKPLIRQEIAATVRQVLDDSGS
jgi:signal transduction histidine kinase/ActR/RegA family two-component response regulator